MRRNVSNLREATCIFFFGYVLIPFLTFLVSFRSSSQRPIGVQIEAQSVTGKKFKMTLEGFEARVFQHEYDHLDGVLYHDRMTPEVRAEVQSYLDSYVKAYEGDDAAL